MTDIYNLEAFHSRVCINLNNCIRLIQYKKMFFLCARARVCVYTHVCVGADMGPVCNEEGQGVLS